jgi:alanine dehydrogenase
MLILTRPEVKDLLKFEEYIPVVEDAFCSYAKGETLGTHLMHVDADGGEFHIKAGGLTSPRPLFAIKINGGFFENRAKYGLPNIQGLIYLADAENGTPLAVMDSGAITINRTGAATAVAAKYLARADSRTVTICGCGVQGRIQLQALMKVLPVTHIYAHSRDFKKADAFSREMSAELDISVIPTDDIRYAARRSDCIVTCTPAKEYFLKGSDVRKGTFIAAVGADSPDKQEIDPCLIAMSKLVTDITSQCVEVGELHHAIKQNLVALDSVYAELGELIVGTKRGRENDDEITIFDSTGTALQDVASAAAVYKKAMTTGVGSEVNLDGIARSAHGT